MVAHDGLDWFKVIFFAKCLFKFHVYKVLDSLLRNPSRAL